MRPIARYSLSLACTYSDAAKKVRLHGRGTSQYAVDIAKELSRQLIASQARVAELEGRLPNAED
jgi:hypothetical protein